MSTFVEDKQRKVIPRWRDVRTASRMGELGSIARGAERPLPDDVSFAEKLQLWQTEPSIAAAADLVGAALVYGREREAVDAAGYLVARADDLENAPAVVTSASTLLLQADPDHNYIPEQVSPLSERLSYDHIHNLRIRLHKDPRNSLAWADLSREYAIIGLPEKAKKAMGVALGLVPDNRFLLRSAARLYVHLNEPDRAHELLRRQHVTQRDPWLLAVEISVAGIAEKTSRFIKEGRLWVADQSLSPFDTSELASALATLDFTAGASKHARRLFRQSLLQPTDNSVGQASWASRHMTGFDLDPSYLQVPRTYEARGWAAYANAEWTDALANYENWLFDQPFSSWPAACGSSLAVIVLGDYKKSEQFTRIGLKANPTNPLLLNNHAVSLALLDRLTEAEEVLGRIKPEECPQTTKIASTATKGLVSFRQGDLARGRSFYQEAIRLAEELDEPRLRSLAKIMLAQEEVHARTDRAKSAYQEAMMGFDKIRDRDFVPLLERVAGEMKRMLPSTARVKLPNGQEVILGRR